MEWKYEEGKIFSKNEQGEIIAEADYLNMKNGMVDIEHVYVSPEYRGKGIAQQTMLAVVEYLRKEKLKATASCSYANAWFKKNATEYEDVIAKELSNQSVSCKIDGKH